MTSLWSTADEDGFRWKDMVNDEGTTMFKMGVKAEDLERVGEAAFEMKREAEVLSDRIAVDWPLGDQNWKPVSVKKITRYRHYDNGAPTWKYTLDFTITGGWGYYFWDESRKKWWVPTPINGDIKTINGYTGNPTIKFVD